MWAQVSDALEDESRKSYSRTRRQAGGRGGGMRVYSLKHGRVVAPANGGVGRPTELSAALSSGLPTRRPAGARSKTLAFDSERRTLRRRASGTWFCRPSQGRARPRVQQGLTFLASRRARAKQSGDGSGLQTHTALASLVCLQKQPARQTDGSSWSKSGRTSRAVPLK